MDSILLEQANVIADQALQKARELKFAPMTVAVLDAGGQLKVLKREDNASLLRPEIALGKAWGVLGMGFGGRELARRAEQMPIFFTALNAMSDGRMVPLPGGVLIRNREGRVIGSVGISGDTSDNDEICAVHGVQAAGLSPDTGRKD
ncbi:MAG: heme-binding protein [Burkholderiales bacterium]|nr:heme-binding protein [Burkholderiales bacterium]